MEVRMQWLKPKEIEEAMERCPTLFLPLGTIEWHGVHNVVGLDAVKAHALCVRAAERAGGLVMPPLFGGVGGLDMPHTFVMDPERSLELNHLRPWLEKLISEAGRQGFKAVIVVTGHYGASQQMAVREAAVRMSKVLNLPVLGTAEYMLGLDQGYYGDHAAFFETSLMMYLHPDTVDLDRLGEEPHEGVGGRDPKKHANAGDGKRIAEAIIGRLASLAEQMPDWDENTVSAFVTAEEALVSTQIWLAGRAGHVRAAWSNIREGSFDAYPGLLTSRRFHEIVELTKLL